MVQFFLDDIDLSSRRFYICKIDRLVRFLRSSLGVESLTLLGIVALVSGEGFTHVGVPLVLLIDEMVSSCDMIVSVSFEASDGVLLFELKVANETAKEVFREGHLLKTGEKAWLAWLC